MISFPVDLSKGSRAHDEFRELVRHLRIDPQISKNPPAAGGKRRAKEEDKKGEERVEQDEKVVEETREEENGCGDSVGNEDQNDEEKSE